MSSPSRHGTATTDAATNVTPLHKKGVSSSARNVRSNVNDGGGGRGGTAAVNQTTTTRPAPTATALPSRDFLRSNANEQTNGNTKQRWDVFLVVYVTRPMVAKLRSLSQQPGIDLTDEAKYQNTVALSQEQAQSSVSIINLCRTFF